MTGDAACQAAGRIERSTTQPGRTSCCGSFSAQAGNQAGSGQVVTDAEWPLRPLVECTPCKSSFFP
jgi:hypothetical protein